MMHCHVGPNFLSKFSLIYLQAPCLNFTKNNLKLTYLCLGYSILQYWERVQNCFQCLIRLHPELLKGDLLACLSSVFLIKSMRFIIFHAFQFSKTISCFFYADNCFSCHEFTELIHIHLRNLFLLFHDD